METEELLAKAAARCKRPALKPEERNAARAAILFYTCVSGHSPWGQQMTPRQQDVDQAVVQVLVDEYRLDSSDARPGFDTARIAAARMRHSTRGGTARRPGKVRGKPGRR